MKRYFLGQAASYSGGDVLRHLFTVGTKRDCDELRRYLARRYKGERAILCKNGRSALCLALKAYFEPGDAILVNGFTCYAVYEAVVAAGLRPVFVDISKDDLNFDMNILKTKCSSVPLRHDVAPARLHGRRAPFSAAASERSLETPDEHFVAESNGRIRGIIIQNSLGNPVDMRAIEKFAEEHDFTIIEDLAHCAGVKYPDGRECGTVGAAVAFSFGKDKSIDAISGGAVVLRHSCKSDIKVPSKVPQLSCHLRARFYPLFGAISRGLTAIHLGGALLQGLVKIHWVEKSADNRLDLERRISKFEAKLALGQFKRLKRSGEPPIREFAFVENRAAVLKELARARYYFDGLWYKQPVSPERYYKKVHFPEADCPNAVWVAKHIVNLPTYYARSDLERAFEIVKSQAISEDIEDKSVAKKERVEK